MNITLELTPEMAQKIDDFAMNRDADAEQMRDAFTRLSAQMKTPQLPKARPARIAGLGRGDVFKMSEDFDDPLPDAFWLGDESTDPLYQAAQKQ